IYYLREVLIVNSRVTYIKQANIFTEKGLLQGNLRIVNGLIDCISKEDLDLPSGVEVIDAKGLYLIPGFIDAHIHGAAGSDTMDATEGALDRIAKEITKEGTTSFLPTTITQSTENINQALENISNHQGKRGSAEVLGIHLEGPFIEKTKKGAQPGEYIVKPNLEQFNAWQSLSKNKIKTITMAPEHDAEGSFIARLSEAGVNVSAR